MKKLILLGLVLILSSYLVSGAFSQSGVHGNYSVDSDVTATILCTPADKNDIGYYVWFNSSGELLENDTIICPTTSPYVMFASWKVTSDQAPQEGLQGNLTEDGVFISGAFFNTTESGGVNDLDIINVDVTNEIYEGRSVGIRGEVQNQGEAIAYAYVCIDVLDEYGEPFAHLGCKYTEADGQWFMSSTCDPNKGWCFGGASYILDIDATCPLNRTNEANVCTKGSVEIEWASGGVSKEISVIDIADKMIIGRNHSGTEEWGIWVENEFGYRVNMTTSLPTKWQEDIDWSSYSQEEGKDFLTAGEKFRVCIVVNNTFDSDQHITMNHLHLLRKTGKMVSPLFLDGSLIKDDEIMHLEVKSSSIENVNYTKCSDWLLVPSKIKGQNNWKVYFHLAVEDYFQEIKLNSNRFTLFGERTDKDYIDYLTLNDVKFTKDNATEGEYVQLELNITNNHPFKDIHMRGRIQLLSNWNLTIGSARAIDTQPYDSIDYLNPDSIFFESESTFPANITRVTISPRYKVPYGLIDQDSYDTLAGAVTLFFDSVFIKQKPLDYPTIDIIDYDLDLINISSTIYNTEVPSCTSHTTTTTYNNIISHTNATKEEEEHFILKGCVEDTTNDVYLYCGFVEVQPDLGINKDISFVSTLPYTPTTIEAELDIWVYSFDEHNLDESCMHCGEQVDFISGDDGQATFNITPNNNDSCRFSKYLWAGKDDELYLQWLQFDALSGINSSAGTFDFDISALNTNTDSVTVTGNGVTGQGQVMNRDVEITCQVVGQPISKTFQTFATTKFNFGITLDGLPEPGTYTVSCTAKDIQFGTFVTRPATDSFSYEYSAGSLSSSSSGARGGGCWTFAKQYNTCYYASFETGLCTKGCPELYECNPDYDFSLLKSETDLEYCVSKTPIKIKDYNPFIVAFVLISLIVNSATSYDKKGLVIKKKKEKEKNKIQTKQGFD